MHSFKVLYKVLKLRFFFTFYVYGIIVKFTIILYGQDLMIRLEVRFTGSILCIILKFKVQSYVIWQQFRDKFNVIF
jgi:hypothetical protein